MMHLVTHGKMEFYKWPGLKLWVKMTYIYIYTYIGCYVTLVTHEWIDFVDRFIWCNIIDFMMHEWKI